MIIRNAQIGAKTYSIEEMFIYRGENKIDFAQLISSAPAALKNDKTLYQKSKVIVNYGSSIQNKDKLIGNIVGVEPGNSFVISCLGQESKFSNKATQTYRNRTISEIAAIISAKYNLKIMIDNTTVRKTWHQSGESDLKFLADRAKELNYQFYISNGTLYFKTPNKKDSVFLDNFLDIRAIWKDTGGSAVNQGYILDPSTKKITTVSSVFVPQLGNQNTKTQGNIIKGVAANSSDDLKAKLNDFGEDQLKLYAKVPGNIRLIPTKTVCVQHGNREFGGYYRICKLKHHLKASGFITEILLTKDDFGGNKTIGDPRLVDLTSKTRTIV